MSEEQRSHTLQIDEDLYQYPLTTPSEEPADFINHSCEPNCGIRGTTKLLLSSPSSSSPLLPRPLSSSFFPPRLHPFSPGFFSPLHPSFLLLASPLTSSLGQISMVAMRTIFAGEEVTYDYAMSDGSSFDEFDCACGAAKCRGKVPPRLTPCLSIVTSSLPSLFLPLFFVLLLSPTTPLKSRL